MTSDQHSRPGRAWPDLFAGLGAIGATMLILVTLPVTLPVALLSDWNGHRRLRAVATVTPCSRCGMLLGPDAPAVSDAAHIAALADMQRRHPYRHVYIVRRAQARCRACSADYVWDGKRRTLHLLADPADAHRDQAAEQAEEEWRCGEQ